MNSGLCFVVNTSNKPNGNLFQALKDPIRLAVTLFTHVYLLSLCDILQCKVTASFHFSPFLCDILVDIL